MTYIDCAIKWAKIAERLYEIETTTDSFRKKWLARHYRYFVTEMCAMYCEKAVHGNNNPV